MENNNYMKTPYIDLLEQCNKQQSESIDMWKYQVRTLQKMNMALSAKASNLLYAHILIH